jgi:hypothetical protein
MFVKGKDGFLMFKKNIQGTVSVDRFPSLEEFLGPCRWLQDVANCFGRSYDDMRLLLTVQIGKKFG